MSYLSLLLITCKRITSQDYPEDRV